MSVENGEWIMHGLDESDPACIHSIEELIEYINQVGFLPLFKNDIPGFSVEERTVPDFWWSGDASKDPWEWRAIIAREGKVAYGKLYGNKAGFVSKEWLPYLANVRRDGYDFDALWEDGKASRRQKMIMDLFLEEDESLVKEFYSNELKEKAGFGKNGEKGFDTVLNSLQMQTYLIVRDFRQRKNKKGQFYGWAVAVVTTPEHIFGRDLVTAAYAEEPEESVRKILEKVRRHFPEAEEGTVRRIVLNQKGVSKKNLQRLLCL